MLQGFPLTQRKPPVPVRTGRLGGVVTIVRCFSPLALAVLDDRVSDCHDSLHGRSDDIGVT